MMTARVLKLWFAIAGLASAPALGAQVVPTAAIGSDEPKAPGKVVWRGSAWRSLLGAGDGDWTFVKVVSHNGRARVTLELSDVGSLGVIAWNIAEGECGEAGKVVVAKRAAARANPTVGNLVILATAPALDESKRYRFAVDWSGARAGTKPPVRRWPRVCAELVKEAATDSSGVARSAPR